MVRGRSLSLSALTPAATAPDETTKTSFPACARLEICSTRSLMTSKSSHSPFEVSTRLPIFTTMRLTPATRSFRETDLIGSYSLRGLMLCRFHLRGYRCLHLSRQKWHRPGSRAWQSLAESAPMPASPRAHPSLWQQSLGVFPPDGKRKPEVRG